MSGNRVFSTILVLAVLALCVAAVPLAAYVGISFLYIEPNPRHLPPVLTGEAVGWAIIGVLSGAFIVIITESVMWPGGGNFWERHRGLVIAVPVALCVGTVLGLFFATIQMNSVDGQAMTSKQLAVAAGSTTGFIGTVAGIITGACLRRYILSLYRVPSARLSGRLTFNDEDATGTAGQAAGRS